MTVLLVSDSMKENHRFAAARVLLQGLLAGTRQLSQTLEVWNMLVLGARGVWCLDPTKW